VTGIIYVLPRCETTIVVHMIIELSLTARTNCPGVLSECRFASKVDETRKELDILFESDYSSNQVETE
jgi:hypothetical protein